MKTLTLRDANQSFARCIREVEAGEEIVITRNGTPVATAFGSVLAHAFAEEGLILLDPRDEAIARLARPVYQASIARADANASAPARDVRSPSARSHCTMPPARSRLRPARSPCAHPMD